MPSYPPPFTGEVSCEARRRGKPHISPFRLAARRLLGTSPARGGGKRQRKRRRSCGRNPKAGRRGGIPTHGSPGRTRGNFANFVRPSGFMCGRSRPRWRSSAPCCRSGEPASSTRSPYPSAVTCARSAAQDARRVAGSTRMLSPKRARKRSMSAGSMATVSENPSARLRRLTTRPCL
jgi:hypothetical protein